MFFLSELWDWREFCWVVWDWGAESGDLWEETGVRYGCQIRCFRLLDQNHQEVSDLIPQRSLTCLLKPSLHISTRQIALNSLHWFDRSVFLRQHQRPGDLEERVVRTLSMPLMLWPWSIFKGTCAPPHTSCGGLSLWLISWLEVLVCLLTGLAYLMLTPGVVCTPGLVNVLFVRRWYACSLETACKMTLLLQTNPSRFLLSPSFFRQGYRVYWVVVSQCSVPATAQLFQGAPLLWNHNGSGFLLRAIIADLFYRRIFRY